MNIHNGSFICGALVCVLGFKLNGHTPELSWLDVIISVLIGFSLIACESIFKKKKK